MCLILIARHVHPQYPLVIAANRDEYFQRPTQPAHQWPGSPGILAGKDLCAGGTWMGIAKNGRFAAVTNVREPNYPSPENPISRGQLVNNFLNGRETSQHHLKQLAPQGQQYEGFNLLCGERDRLWHFSNRSNSFTELEAGLHGLSNAGLNSPWPKVEQGKKALERTLKQKHFSLDNLLPILNHRQRAEPQYLPDTGIGPILEFIFSSRFIEGSEFGYGTRTSTGLTLDQHGQVEFKEWSWNDQGQLTDSVQYKMTLES